MRRLILASLAVAATLVSCQKESTVDASLTNNQTITYAPYAGASATKGTPVDSNTTFAGTTTGNAFEVAAYSGDDKYFGFSTVTYNTTTPAWTNTDEMYWPNATTTLHFGAYYPSSSAVTTPAYSYASDAHSLTFGYTAASAVASQVDLMYAVANHAYTAPTTGTSDTPEANTSVPLHFKHALTQVGFTATKSADINVTVNSITICNVVDNGEFEATAVTTDSSVTDSDTNGGEDPTGVITTNFGTWTNPAAAKYEDAQTVTNLSNYAAKMNGTDGAAVKVEAATGAETATTLTSATDVLMLIPQTLAAWDPEGTVANTGTESYLAIDCEITHADGTAAIIDGIIYVPFSTADIEYTSGTKTNGWKSGYKITYNLDFGGGYTIPGTTTTDPEDTPGTTPDPDDVIPTLRAVTYTITVDEWIPVSAPGLTF